MDLLARNERTSPLAFWLGTLGVSIGVILHIPMFIEAADSHYRMVGMPMCTPMLVGMGLIVVGTVLAGYGLLPIPPKPNAAPAVFQPPPATTTSAPSDQLTTAHWQIILVLVAALVIDTMKPATLGFVVPGSIQEYGISKATVALLPFSGLTGTAVGSFLWGILADKLGRRAAILIAAIMFIGTSICGAMPTFEWNVAMCFMMGLSAGGMMPIAYTLLAETIPTRHRGWCLVLLGGLGLVGGYFAAAGCAALLEPHFGWRILWLIGLPTGLLLILCNRFIPESPRFLLLHGRVAEANQVMARFGMPPQTGQTEAVATPDMQTGSLLHQPFLGTTVSLNLIALAWGLINFGLLLWLPTDLRSEGFTVASSDALLFQSSLIALPTSCLVAFLYSKWSTRWTLVVMGLITAAGLLALSLMGTQLVSLGSSPVLLFAVLMTGCNGLIAVLLPYAAENYPLQIRGRATGLVAAFSKSGGIVAQSVAMASLVPPLTTASLILAFPIMLGSGLVATWGKETRDRDLAALDQSLSKQPVTEKAHKF